MNLLLILLLIITVMALQLMMWQRWFSSPVKQRSSAEMVHGIAIHQQCSYHPRHAWLRCTSESTAVVGMDDFARRLVGPINKVILPLAGSEIHQGESCVRFIGLSKEVSLVAPISGRVLEVNHDLASQPELPWRDPYGEGWLFRLTSWRLQDQQNHLISGVAVEAWMNRSVEKLINSLESTLGAVSQDGGYLAEDLSEPLATQDWIQIIRKHLGTEPLVR